MKKPPAAKIPLVDLKAQFRGLEPEILGAMRQVCEAGDFILGSALAQFERDFAQYCGSRHAVGCGSGTDALQLACRALDIGPGDEVIMPAHTFVGTALGIELAGAKPVLVDVEAKSGLLDPSRIEASVTPKTRAILPVHLYGQCAPMDALREIAKQHSLAVIEDAAQAHGARFGDRRAGSLGDLGCFSFYPAKNLGCFGDGGMVVTDRDDLADRLRMLRNWGSREKYHHEESALNSRLDTLQAAILGVKLPHLDAWNARRAELARAYDHALGGIPGIELTQTRAGSVHHLYVVRTGERNRALEALQAAGYGAGIHYPFAVHELRSHRHLGYEAGSFPVAEDWARRCLSLPLYPEMPPETVDAVAHCLAGHTG